MKMSFNAAQRRTLALTVGCLGGILTDIETVEEIAAMPNHPTNYPTSDLVKRLRDSADEWEICGPSYIENAEFEREAANAIEAQAARIAELEAEVKGLKQGRVEISSSAWAAIAKLPPLPSGKAHFLLEDTPIKMIVRPPEKAVNMFYGCASNSSASGVLIKPSYDETDGVAIAQPDIIQDGDHRVEMMAKMPPSSEGTAPEMASWNEPRVEWREPVITPSMHVPIEEV